MRNFKSIAVVASCLTLMACSGGPSDTDMQVVTKQSEQQLDQQMAPLGLRWSDVFETKLAIKNKAKQDDGRWLIEAETTMTAKKDMKELPQEVQLLVAGIAGDFRKGQAIGGGPVTTKFYMHKGEQGWIAVQ